MRLSAIAVLIGLLAFAATVRGAGPQPSPPTAPPFAAVGLEAKVAAAVVVTVTVPAGSVRDREGRSGTASLLGKALVGEVNARLYGLEAQLSGSVERSVARYRLVAAPHEWREAWRRVDSVLFGDVAPTVRIDVVRDSVLSGLGFELGSPASEFEHELASFVGRGMGDDWVRPPMGTLGDVAAVTPSDAADLHAEHYRKEHSVVVITGPETVLPGPSPASTPPRPASLSRLTDVVTGRSRIEPMPNERLDVVRNITATWLAIAYPAPDDTPRTALEFAVAIIRNELKPNPPAPQSYDVDIDVVDTPAGTLVLVTAVLYPDVAAQWEADALAAVARIVSEPPVGDAFSWQRRRFRGLRLLEDQDASLAGERITADLLRDGKARQLAVEIDALTPSSLAAVLLALREPRVLSFGPGR